MDLFDHNLIALKYVDDLDAAYLFIFFLDKL